MDKKIKVYIEIDEKSNITKVFSDIFEQPSESSVLLDEGYGDKYAHAQSHYFEKPLRDFNGIYNYKRVGNGVAFEKTPEEIQAETTVPQTQPLTTLALLEQSVTDLEIRDIEKDIAITDLEIGNMEKNLAITELKGELSKLKQKLEG